MWADRKSKKKSRRGGWLLAALVVVVVVIAGGVAVFNFFRPPGPVPPPIPGPLQPTPSTQPASCPDVQVVAVPGTWESSPTDDPHNPTFNPNALLLNVTRPLQNEFAASRADVVTVPYVAQFAHFGAPPQETYDQSRAQGTKTTEDMIASMAKGCPLTHYVLMGFSQGAVIAGDVAAKIGAGQGPVAADRVLGVGLVADGRREMSDAAVNLGIQTGVGAEVVLRGLHDVPGVPGATMTGPRPGGLGSLTSKTVQICAPGDLICAAPPNSFTLFGAPGALVQLAGASQNPVHAKYNSFVVDSEGQSSTQYLTSWASGLINGAPTPAHN